VYIHIYIMWEIKKCYLRVNEQRNIQHEIRKQKINWIGHILLINCLLKQIIVGKIKGEIEVTRRRGRRRKKLLDELKDRRGYCHLKEEALDRTMWRNHFGRGIGTFVRQITEWMNIYVYIFFFSGVKHFLSFYQVSPTLTHNIAWSLRCGKPIVA